MNFLIEADRVVLQKNIEKAEKIGHLTPEQLEIIYKNNWFNLFVPNKNECLQYDFIEALKIEEELAYIDGSLGWTVTLCAGANMFVGFMNKEESTQIFSQREVCLGGSGKVGGTARKKNDTYIINGEWHIVTGLHHCTIFTANCLIEEEGELKVDESGKLEYRSFFFYPEEVEIAKTWQADGLIATGSDSIQIKDLEVPTTRSFVISENTCVINHPIYRFPFLGFAKLTLAVNHLGMQAHYIDEVEKFFKTKRGSVHQQFQEELLISLKEHFNRQKEKFYKVAETTWQKVQNNKAICSEDFDEIDAICQKVVFSGRDNIIKSLPYLGLYGVSKQYPVFRIVKDILVGCQHSLFL